MNHDQDPNQNKWQLPPRKDKYTYADIFPIDYLGINYEDLRGVMQDRSAERDIADTVYSWLLNSSFHNGVLYNLERGRNIVDISNLAGLYGELKTMVLMAGMLPDPMIGIQVDEFDQVVFPTFRGRNEVQLGMHGGSVILTDPRLGPSDIKKKEIDFLMGHYDPTYGLIPIIGQVKLNLNDVKKAEADLGINRMAYLTKVFNNYSGFVPIFFTLWREHREEVSELIEGYRHIGGTVVPISIHRKTFKDVVNQYSYDYGLRITGR